MSKIMVPPLEILLGLLNKIVLSWEGMCRHLEKSEEWEPTVLSRLASFLRDLSISQHIIRAKRELYYDMKLSGAPCNLLMSRICKLFFLAEVEIYEPLLNFILFQNAGVLELRDYPYFLKEILILPHLGSGTTYKDKVSSLMKCSRTLRYPLSILFRR